MSACNPSRCEKFGKVFPFARTGENYKNAEGVGGGVAQICIHVPQRGAGGRGGGLWNAG